MPRIILWGDPVFQTMLQIPATMMSKPEQIPPMLKPRPNFSDLRGTQSSFYGRLPGERDPVVESTSSRPARSHATGLLAAAVSIRRLVVSTRRAHMIDRAIHCFYGAGTLHVRLGLFTGLSSY